jgi:xanthine/CO dehydrogenase XdhC/CoxF family maturation factor
MEPVMLAHETRQVLEAARQAWAKGQRVALATVVRVLGSAYRREGAKMLAHEDGSATCMISGGCLEPEIVEVAKGVMRQGRPVRTRYQLDEDVMWGLGLGCGGTVEVLIEPLEQGSLPHRFLELQAQGEEGVLATALAGGEGHLLVLPHGTAQGALMPQHVQERVVAAATHLLQEAAPKAGTVQVEGVEVFLDVSVPPPELVVFGAGHDAIPLVALAQQVGFRVTLVDPRPAYATQERFPGARIVLAHPHALRQRLSLSPRSYVVIMNHHVERDREALELSLASPAPYIGLLGPRSRFQRIVQGLELGPQDLERVHTPVGLDLGGEAPEEVAVSIMAEVMATWRGASGRPLREKEGPIHQRLQPMS